jgi:hypothetical protein
MLAPAEVLRGVGRCAPTAERVPAAALVAVIAIAGFMQGAVMGSHDGRLMQSVYSGIKVPLLLLVATGVCLPSFYVAHLALDLHRDFVAACRGVIVAQAGAALFLASCAPLVAFAYVSSDSYPFATFANGLVYFGAAIVAQAVLAQHYRPLVARDRQHRVTLAFWLVLYVLVAIQCAWTMRPFIGWDALEPSLIRAEAWGNAYVRLFDAVGKLFTR